MVSLPVEKSGSGDKCGSSCGAGLEKIYPSTAVRYGAMNWIGEFNYRKGSVFKCGAKVVIHTGRGIEIGRQVSLSCGGCDKSVTREQIKTYIKNSGPEFYRLRSGKILREATPADISEHEHLNAHNREDIDRAALLAAQSDLDMKIVTVEHLFGGERIVFYFRSEARIDFRGMVHDLAEHYRTRIEMRQVGARDEARLVADYEICGRECCCKNFLKKLRPVGMKMAKVQKSTLDPSKVSGRCGRLRCCLRYEHEGYEELVRKLPRVGSFVEVEPGVARVVDRQILTQLVLVRTRDGTLSTFPIEEIKAFNVDGSKFEVAPPNVRPERPPRKPRGAKPAEGKAKDARADRPDPRRRGDAPPPSPKPTPPPKSDSPSGSAPKTPDNQKPTDNATGDAQAPRPRKRRRRRPRRRGSGPNKPGGAEK